MEKKLVSFLSTIVLFFFIASFPLEASEFPLISQSKQKNVLKVETRSKVEQLKDVCRKYQFEINASSAVPEELGDYLSEKHKSLQKAIVKIDLSLWRRSLPIDAKEEAMKRKSVLVKKRTDLEKDIAWLDKNFLRKHLKKADDTMDDTEFVRDQIEKKNGSNFVK